MRNAESKVHSQIQFNAHRRMVCLVKFVEWPQKERRTFENAMAAKAENQEANLNFPRLVDWTQSQRGFDRGQDEIDFVSARSGDLAPTESKMVLQMQMNAARTTD